jgi:hypothetical protein
VGITVEASATDGGCYRKGGLNMVLETTIRAEEVIRDICSGMAGVEIMKKNDLTAVEFEAVLRHLVASDLLTRQMIQSTEQISESQVFRVFGEYP